MPVLLDIWPIKSVIVKWNKVFVYVSMPRFMNLYKTTDSKCTSYCIALSGLGFYLRHKVLVKHSASPSKAHISANVSHYRD